MANTTRYGFVPVMKGMGDDPNPRKYPATGSQAVAIGDVMALDSAGRAVLATASTTKGTYLGVAASALASTAAAGDAVYVWDDPNMLFEGMASTGALANSYTTRSGAACYDLAGATGAQYVNTASSTYDVFKCVGECAKDPVLGIDSAVGTNQMKYWKFNPLAHAYGTVA